ncbi:Cyn operon transcriptional activator [Serratia ficaria]|uniref:LysR family transcriptional regulator n=1 Tax=Serratia ficaria TaxID=61651 RepID=UPI00218369C7|nr:LysR family transcriptional regulator [Serratia ficaria]CAI2479861.1 Cyn operon transcriptional activator [Serratia ficaria]
MRIRHLHYFLIVAEEQSFTRAAARVHIEPSPLSRAIKELENQLGVRLLDRAKGRIRLTWPGEVFREEARRMLAFMDSAQTRVNSASQGYRGRLRIGLADSLAQPRLTRLLARCREEEPRTEVRIAEMTVQEMLQALRHDQIDVGFTVDGEAVNSCVKEPVWAERPAIAIPTHHPLLSFDKVPLEEALRYPLIFCHPEQCAGGHNVIRRWFNDGLSPSLSVAEYVSGHEPMIMLVAAGYGIGIGLESQMALYSHPDVIVRPVADEVPDSTTFIVVPDRPASKEMERFIKRAQEIGRSGIK